MASCLNLDDVIGYSEYSESYVYDIEVKDNHNYYLDLGYKVLVHNSTKTWSTLQLLAWIAIHKAKQIDIVGLTVPHLKSGVINDMPHVLKSLGVDFYDIYNGSDKKLMFPSGGIINFIAIDTPGKAHGGRRDILYLNEANHLHYNIAEQLMVRTRDKIFIDYNPTNVFWAHKKVLKDEPEKSLLIKSTYKDNPMLESAIVDMIESKKGDGNNNFWRVYGMGELGVAEGLIFDNFEQGKFDKDRFANYYYGLDWGFSTDPFAFVKVAIEQNTLYICDEVYEQGLLNKESSEQIEPIVGKNRVICDSAEPKSISEYRKLYRINAYPAKKGAGSIEFGIKKMQEFDKIVIHQDCFNIYNEFCNYQWKKDKNDEALDKPIDEFNHAIDAIRYALEDFSRTKTNIVGNKRIF